MRATNPYCNESKKILTNFRKRLEIISTLKVTNTKICNASLKMVKIYLRETKLEV